MAWSGREGGGGDGGDHSGWEMALRDGWEVSQKEGLGHPSGSENMHFLLKIYLILLLI